MQTLITQSTRLSVARPVHWLLPAARIVALLACTVPLSCGAAEYQQSSINLPASTAAFESRYDIDGDGRRDLLAIFQRRIMVFFQGESGRFPTAPDIEIGAGQPIPETYAALAVGKIMGAHGLQLILIGENGCDYLTVAQLRGTSDQPVEPVQLLRKKIDISPGPDLVLLDAAVDIDGNGQTELVLPNGNQLEMYEYDDKGEFAPRSKLDIPVQTIQRTVLQHEPPLFGSLMAASGYHEMVQAPPRPDRWHGIQFVVQDASDPFLVCDYNRDRKWDVITPRKIAYGQESGRFDIVQTDTYSKIALAALIRKGSGFLTDNRVAVAPNLVDFNGDGILDTFRVESTAAKLSPRTDIPIFLGRPDRTFADKPDFQLHTRDLAYCDVIPIGDLNGDGCQDIALFHFDFQPSSASSQLKSYISKGLEGELRFYLWDRVKNRFPDNYDSKLRINVSYGIYGMRQFFQQQVLMSSDMDGDKLPDLTMKTGPTEISVYRNGGGNKGFTSKPAARLATPTKFSSIIVQDLNGDGKGDIGISGYLDNQEDRTIYTFFVSK